MSRVSATLPGKRHGQAEEGGEAVAAGALLLWAAHRDMCGTWGAGPDSTRGSEAAVVSHSTGIGNIQGPTGSAPRGPGPEPYPTLD